MAMQARIEIVQRIQKDLNDCNTGLDNEEAIARVKATPETYKDQIRILTDHDQGKSHGISTRLNPA